MDHDHNQERLSKENDSGEGTLLLRMACVVPRPCHMAQPLGSQGPSGMERLRKRKLQSSCSVISSSLSVVGRENLGRFISVWGKYFSSLT